MLVRRQQLSSVLIHAGVPSTRKLSALHWVCHILGFHRDFFWRFFEKRKALRLRASSCEKPKQQRLQGAVSCFFLQASPLPPPCIWMCTDHLTHHWRPWSPAQRCQVALLSALGLVSRALWSQLSMPWARQGEKCLDFDKSPEVTRKSWRKIRETKSS